MKTLEKVMEEILKSFGTEGTFTLRAHELTHDGVGWSSNDRWKILTEGNLKAAVSEARGRWEVFKANYNSKARVKDIECLEIYSNEGHVECACLPFLDVEFHPSEWMVTVGNIGQVYCGNSYEEAKSTFDEYREQSDSGYGRAAGEEVTIMVNGEPYEESK